MVMKFELAGRFYAKSFEHPTDRVAAYTRRRTDGRPWDSREAFLFNLLRSPTNYIFQNLIELVAVNQKERILASDLKF